MLYLKHGVTVASIIFKHSLSMSPYNVLCLLRTGITRRNTYSTTINKQ